MTRIIPDLSFLRVSVLPTPASAYTGQLRITSTGLYWSDGAAWRALTAQFAPVVVETGTTALATPATSGNYTVFTNEEAKTYTFDGAQGYVEGAEYHGRNTAAGELTISATGGMTVNPPATGTLVVPEGGTFTVKIVAADEADLMGVTTSGVTDTTTFVGKLEVIQDYLPGGEHGIEVSMDNTVDGSLTHASVTSTSYGLNGGGTFHGRGARGSRVAPSAVLAGDNFGGIGGRPFHSGGEFFHSSPVAAHWIAKEDMTPTTAGACWRVLTTKVGTPQSQRKVAAVYADDGDFIVGEYDNNPAAALGGRGIVVIRENSPVEQSQYAFGASGFAAGIRLIVARGTVAAPSNTLNGDGAFIGMGGHDGTSLIVGSAAGVFFAASADWSPTSRPTRIELSTTDAGSTTRAVRWFVHAGGAFHPAADNTHTVGGPGARVSEFWGASGTINTSDAREKTAPRDMTPEEIACSRDLAALPCVFQFLDSIERKGDDARLHVGPTVQAVIETMRAHGLDPFRYSFVCYDRWPEHELPAQTEKRLVKPATYNVTPAVFDEIEVPDKNGEPKIYRRMVAPETSEVAEEAVYEEVIITPARTVPAGDRYSLRPSGLQHFVKRGHEERLRRLEALLSGNT